MKIRRLDVSFPSDGKTNPALKNISLNLKKGEVLGIVESGAGKSTIGNAIINILESPGKITNGEIIFNGLNLCHLNQQEMNNVRGKKIGIIFQDPLSALNPLMTIGDQLKETIRRTNDLKPIAVEKKAVELLVSVGMSMPNYG